MRETEIDSSFREHADRVSELRAEDPYFATIHDEFLELKRTSGPLAMSYGLSDLDHHDPETLGRFASLYLIISRYLRL